MQPGQSRVFNCLIANARQVRLFAYAYATYIQTALCVLRSVNKLSDMLSTAEEARFSVCNVAAAISMTSAWLMLCLAAPF